MKLPIFQDELAAPDPSVELSLSESARKKKNVKWFGYDTIGNFLNGPYTNLKYQRS